MGPWSEGGGRLKSQVRRHKHDAGLRLAKDGPDNQRPLHIGAVHMGLKGVE